MNKPVEICVYGMDRLIDPFNLSKDDLDPVSMAHSLSQLNRYTGHCVFPYSVAQHTKLLVDFVPQHLKRTAAIHEWTEPFFNDSSRPMKRKFPGLVTAENELLEEIFDLMGEPFDNLKEFEEYDIRICKDEMQALFPHFQPEWHTKVALGVEIVEKDWKTAKQELIDTYAWVL